MFFSRNIIFVLFLAIALTASPHFFSGVSASLDDYVPNPRDGDWVIEKEVRDFYNSDGYFIDSLDIGYKYDDEGRLSLVDGSPNYSIELKYDNDGQLESLVYRDGTARLTHEYIYDGDNRLRIENLNVYRFESADTHGDGYYYGDNITYNYIYDDDGNLIRKDVDFDDNGVIEQTIQFFYNNHAHLSKEELYDLNHRLLIEKKYTYDSDGKLINLAVFDGTGRQDTTTTYEYNEEGRLTRKKSSGLENLTSTYFWGYSKPFSPSSDSSDETGASGDGDRKGCFLSILLY
jgi:hypothetical protein